jgi:hypothetical protein
MRVLAIKWYVGFYVVIPSSSFRKELLITIERALPEMSNLIGSAKSHVVIPDGLSGRDRLLTGERAL